MRSWKFWLGVLVSAFFVYLAAREQHWSEFSASLADANYWWILPGIIIYFGAVWARTWRWHYMLRHLKPIRLSRLFPVVVIGYMGNNVYPLRAGEVIRSYVLRRKEGISISASLATVALERLFDGLVMTVFVFATLPFLALPAEYRTLVIGASSLFGVALVVFLLLAGFPQHTDALVSRMINLFVPVGLRPKVQDLAGKFLQGLHSLRSPREVLMIFGTSVAIWLTETTKYWFVMHAFPGLNVSFAVLMLVTAVVNLATMIPSSPGYVGTFDLPAIKILNAVGGVTQSLAAAYTVVLHLALWLPITLLGLFYMSRESLRWREIDVAVGEQRQQGDPEPIPTRGRPSASITRRLGNNDIP